MNLRIHSIFVLYIMKFFQHSPSRTPARAKPPGNEQRPGAGTAEALIALLIFVRRAAVLGVRLREVTDHAPLDVLVAAGQRADEVTNQLVPFDVVHRSPACLKSFVRSGFRRSSFAS